MEKLKKNYEFSKVFKSGKRQFGRELSIYFVKNKLAYNRLGFTTVKKYGNAVQRNRERRLLREAYRNLEPQLKHGYDIVIMGRNSEKLSDYHSVRADMLKLFTRAKLLEETTEICSE